MNRQAHRLHYPLSRVLKNRDGFTLIEAIVAGIIAAVIAGLMIVFLNVFFAQVKQGTLRAKMQMDYDIISQQIGASVRASQVVLGPGEAVGQNFATASTVTEINCFSAAGNKIAKYWINNGVIWDSLGGIWGAPGPFLIGNRQITVTANSGFTLPAGRKSVQLSLNPIETYLTISDSLFIQGDGYLCRN
jgi:hypothetical protein